MKNAAETPGWLRIPTPTTETLPIWSSYCRDSKPTLVLIRSRVLIATWPSVLGRVNEMSVRPVATALTFCTIMSMLISASATAWKIRAASPILSGTPTTVILASLRSCAMPEMIACSIGLLRQALRFGKVHDPGALALRERRAHVHGHVVLPGVLDAAQGQHLRAAGRHLEHLLVGDPGQLPGGRHDPRVGREDAVDVGVDLADLGAHRRGQRDRRRVRGAAAHRGDVLGVLADALEAGHDRDVALARAPR